MFLKAIINDSIVNYAIPCLQQNDLNGKTADKHEIPLLISRIILQSASEAATTHNWFHNRQLKPRQQTTDSIDAMYIWSLVSRDHQLPCWKTNSRLLIDTISCFGVIMITPLIIHQHHQVFQPIGWLNSFNNSPLVSTLFCTTSNTFAWIYLCICLFINIILGLINPPFPNIIPSSTLPHIYSCLKICPGHDSLQLCIIFRRLVSGTLFPTAAHLLFLNLTRSCLLIFVNNTA